MRKINVCFLGYETNYQGGINYLKNLFFAIKQLKNSKINLLVFVGKKDKYQSDLYSPYIKVVKTSLLDRYSLLWFINRFFWRCFKYPVIVDIYCRLYKIDILSHSPFSSKYMKSKILFWIPDFQPLVLSYLWQKKEVEKWRKVYYRHIKESNAIVLSSKNAFKDYLDFAPKYKDKVKVLHFVSQPSSLKSNIKSDLILKKYDIKTKFFYLPNQFWKHKNHMVVFEAINILKSQVQDILVVCTGLLEDFRNGDNTHISSILSYIKKNNLENNIKILGVVEYSEVLWFMKNSIAVINPSLFEGWSSTVEESKSIGQRIILSNIDVHKEQNPVNGYYFDKNNPVELSKVLLDIVNEKEVFKIDEEKTDKDLAKRTLLFAQNYQNIALSLFEK